MKYLISIIAVAAPALTAALSVSQGAKQAHLHTWDDGDDNSDIPLPLVIWHGLGDSFDNDGLTSIVSLANSIHPSTYTYVVRLDESPSQDSRATFIGNVSAQVDVVCAALAADPIISTAPAIDALGFSQGGLFLRGYVERCNTPPVRSLVTFGSPHNGVEELRECSSADLICKGAMSIFRRNAWSAWVQSNLVPAQYYRPAVDMEQYLEKSSFLADINNERSSKNAKYVNNIASLENFVMIMFTEDRMIVPKESTWFAEADDSGKTPLRARKIYTEDWLGLRVLDLKGGLHFREVVGEHMRFTKAYIAETIREFFGPLKKTTKTGGLISDYVAEDL